MGKLMTLCAVKGVPLAITSPLGGLPGVKTRTSVSGGKTSMVTLPSRWASADATRRRQRNAAVQPLAFHLRINEAGSNTPALAPLRLPCPAKSLRRQSELHHG